MIDHYDTLCVEVTASSLRNPSHVIAIVSPRTPPRFRGLDDIQMYTKRTRSPYCGYGLSCRRGRYATLPMSALQQQRALPSRFR